MPEMLTNPIRMKIKWNQLQMQPDNKDNRPSIDKRQVNEPAKNRRRTNGSQPNFSIDFVVRANLLHSFIKASAAVETVDRVRRANGMK